MSSTEILLPVFGMSCHNCERKVEAGIDELAGVSWSKADHKENSLCDARLGAHTSVYC